MLMVNKNSTGKTTQDTEESNQITKARAQSCVKTKVSTEVIWGNMTTKDKVRTKAEQKVFSFSRTEVI